MSTLHLVRAEPRVTKKGPRGPMKDMGEKLAHVCDLCGLKFLPRDPRDPKAEHQFTDGLDSYAFAAASFDLCTPLDEARKRLGDAGP